jgi:glyoxylase-like metal-dependent hydrolase (beta-lactamase superfamily II)
MLSASPRVCWHHWPTQLKSLERLLDFRFRWVLPGHGQGYRAEGQEAMRRELETAIAYLKSL